MGQYQNNATNIPAARQRVRFESLPRKLIVFFLAAKNILSTTKRKGPVTNKKKVHFVSMPKPNDRPQSKENFLLLKPSE